MSADVESVAIIGMAGRFPGASDIDRFWDLLRTGVEGFTRFTEEELVAAGVPLELIRNPQYVPVKGAVADADLFDAHFFGYTPREASLMDPQQRLMLECGWHALEHAGYDPERYQGSIGVYAGAGANTYIIAQLGDVMTSDPAAAYQIFISNDKDFLATRLSYKSGFRGPSVTVQTACSTSLVAIHLATQALLSHQCDVVLAGGVAATFPQVRGYLYQEGMILSPDGHCRAFDVKGAGIVPGEGVAVVVLKRLSEALADNDNVLAVIKGSAINNDGADKAGYTAPSVDGQAEVIAMAQAVADVDPDTISYVEAHGTATPLGDPIEIAALTKAFRTSTERRNYCAIGSLKSNIGHLDTAAGVAGVVKTVLALQHKQIPPSLNFETPNPALELTSSPFYVNTGLREWRAESGSRRAGVSSFGIGGTNAHVVLEEAPEAKASDTPRRRAEVLVLSARSEEALGTAARQLGEHLRAHPDVPLADVAHTLQVGRKRFEYRRTVVCRSVEAALVSLDAEASATFEERRRRGVVFMFPGQGAQRPGMARLLYEHEPAFRDALDDCFQQLEQPLGLDLRALLCTAQENEDTAEKLAQTSMTQPALFVVEYALARLWMSWGIEPEAMIGHSIGEYVAACLAGVFTLGDALSLVTVRGRLMQSMPRGAMLAVPLPASELGDILESGLELAASNAPSLCSVGGTPEAVDRAERQLEARGIGSRRLQTSHAFHSSHMEPILATFTQHVSRIRGREPAIPFISGVTGTWITPEQATDPHYWASQLRQPVRFSDGVRAIGPDRMFLEVGPGRALATLVRQAGGEYATVTSSLEQAGRSDDDVRILGALADLWRAGCEVDWTAFRDGERRARVALPMYPFEHRRHWIDRSTDTRPTAQIQAPSLMRRANLTDWFSVTSWRRSVNPNELTTNSEPDSGVYLVFVDGSGLGAALTATWTAAGRDVVGIEVGSAYARVNANSYRVNPGELSDYRRLIDDLLGAGRIPSCCIHLWSVAPDLAPSDASSIDAALARGFFSVVFLVQALSEHRQVGSRLFVVADRSQEVLGTEDLRPEGAMLTGPCEALASERSGIVARFIDLDASGDVAGLANVLAMEIDSGTEDPVVAYRGRHRWIRSFEPVSVGAPSDKKQLPGRQRTCLITGGFGGLGLSFARYLVAGGWTQIALVGRVGLPPRSEWAAWTRSHGDDDRTAKRIRAVESIEAAGATVLPIEADVADVVQMRRAIDECRVRLGRVDGVIHAAGIAGGGVIQLRTQEDMRAVIGPKVKGLLVLNDVLADDPPDFLLACSSFNSVVVSAGQSDYAAANAFIDAFARRSHLVGQLRVFSVSWPGWKDFGMAAEAQVPDALRTSHMRFLNESGISEKDGLEVFARVLDQNLPHTIVTPIEVEALRRATVPKETKRTDSGTAVSISPAVVGNTRRALSTELIEPRNEVEASLAGIWQELLGVDVIGVRDNFFELGGHSLLAVQIASRVRSQYQIDLPLKRFFEAVTIAELSEEISAVLWANEGSTPEEAAAGDREEFRL